MTQQTARQFTLKSVGITSVSNKTYDITELVLEFSIYESINNPYILGSLILNDSGENLLSNMPLQGQERISIKVQTEIFSNKVYEYDLTVSGIDVRLVSNRSQVYKLNLISFAGLMNEGIRIGKVLEGTNDQIVTKVLNEFLKIDAGKIKTEPAKFPQKYLPSLKRPFDFIYQLAKISVSASTPVGNAGKSTSSSASAVKNQSTSDLDSANATKLSGTAGYLFFETYDGYVFKSLDNLCSDGTDGAFKGSPIKYTYTYALSNDGYTDDLNHLKIIDYTFLDEFDVHKQLREGLYSTMCIFFDVNNCTYEENLFKVEDTYNQMAHLGSSTKIPAGAKELSKYPTRIMTQMINNELFHNDKKTSAKADARYKDTYKYSIAQSNARYKLAANQQINITIPPNLTIRAGDKIELRFPNMSSQEQRKLKPYDEEHSGNYLIKNIGYNFIVRGAQPMTGTTNITLVRDSVGMKNTASKQK